MYTKIKKICEGCWESKNVFLIFLLSFVIIGIAFVIDYSIKGGWELTLHYPEESYQEIEEEANRIFLSGDLDTEYKFEVDSYYSSSKDLSFTLHGENNTFIDVTIRSFGMPDSEISIDRASNNQVTHFLIDILCLLIVPAFLALLVLIAILIVASVTWFISFIIYKIISCIKKK